MLAKYQWAGIECRNYLQTGIPYQKSEIQLPYIQKKADVIDPPPVIEGNPEELVKEIKNKPVKTCRFHSDSGR